MATSRRNRRSSRRRSGITKRKPTPTSKEYRGWNKNIRFHFIAVIVFTVVLLAMIVLTIFGVSNWFTWTVLVVSAIMAVVALIELPPPSSR